MPIRKIARMADAAIRDAELARRAQTSPEFRRKVQADRRGALSEFKTVQHALEDRERIERRKGQGASKKESAQKKSGRSRSK
jgi:hypothetical protein